MRLFKRKKQNTVEINTNVKLPQKEPLSSIGLWGVLISLGFSFAFLITLFTSLKPGNVDFNFTQESWIFLIIMQFLTIFSVIFFASVNTTPSKYVAAGFSFFFSGIIGGMLIFFAKTPSWRESIPIILPKNTWVENKSTEKNLENLNDSDISINEIHSVENDEIPNFPEAEIASLKTNIEEANLNKIVDSSKKDDLSDSDFQHFENTFSSNSNQEEKNNDNS